MDLPLHSPRLLRPCPNYGAFKSDLHGALIVDNHGTLIADHHGALSVDNYGALIVNSHGALFAHILFAHGSHDVGVCRSGKVGMHVESGHRDSSLIRIVSNKQHGVFESWVSQDIQETRRALFVHFILTEQGEQFQVFLVDSRNNAGVFSLITRKR